MENKHCLHVYTGPGKGKTSAAMGLALRMLGHGHRVLVAQFMKQPGSGELLALQQLPSATVLDMAPMTQFTYQMTEEELQQTKARQTAELSRIATEVNKLQPALLVLDELCMALAFRLVPKDEAEALLNAALEKCEVVVTGRDAPQWLMDRADYVSFLEAVKHPFEQGLMARPGIEY